ncbi:MAG: endo-1,4-beta-xylanase [Sedimentisphaerales bacterium]|nr:endo-1,4-beta-xylanase [Sedimentisphaerales bacterium]
MNGRSMNKHVAIASILVFCLIFAQLAPAAGNRIENPGFETGNTNGWFAFPSSSSCTISAVSNIEGNPNVSGNWSGYASNRQQDYSGFSQSLMGKLVAGKTYQVSGWMMLNAGGPAASAIIKATIKKTQNGATTYDELASRTGTTEVWTQLNGLYTHTSDDDLTGLDFYFETPGVTYSYRLDDVVVIDTDDAGLIDIEITGPPRVNENSGYQYKCIAHYGDGSTSYVTNSTTWSEDSTYASISSTGFLTTSLITSDQTCTITAIYEGFVDTYNITITDLEHTPIGIEITGPSEVYEKSSEWFTCRVNYKDFTSSDITYIAAWSMDCPYATIDNTGYLTTSAVSEDQYCTITASYGGYYDSFNLTIVDGSDWRIEANERIEQIRKRDAQIKVVDLAGRPITGVNVQISQKRHHFAFGSAINNKSVGGTRNMSNPDYKNFFKNHFEWAVCEDESKWYSNEPTQGNVTYTDADIIYNWCSTNGIKMRGHCLFWEVENIQLNYQTWVWNLPYAPLPETSPLRTAVQNRMNSAMNHFKGKFLHWDIDNEILSGWFYQERLGEAIIPWMFRTARQIDPACKLFVNEYAGNSFGWYDGWTYAYFIDYLRDSGTPIHGIGIQGHVEAGFNGRKYFNDVLEPLSEVDLPIWVTEADSPNPYKALQANDMEDLYRIAFSHPSVEGILMWGFWEGSHWRENWWIVNADWTLNEVGLRYEALMNEWTTNDEKTTDAGGSLTFRGFHGVYELALAVPGAPIEVKTIELEPGDTAQQFILQMNIESEEPQNCTDIVAMGLSLDSDLNHDCRVNYGDLEILVDYWLADDCVASDNCEGADFEPADGVVDFFDLSDFAMQWMQCNDPEDPDCTPTW